MYPIYSNRELLPSKAICFFVLLRLMDKGTEHSAKKEEASHSTHIDDIQYLTLKQCHSYLRVGKLMKLVTKIQNIIIIQRIIY